MIEFQILYFLVSDPALGLAFASAFWFFGDFATSAKKINNIKCDNC